MSLLPPLLPPLLRRMPRPLLLSCMVSLATAGGAAANSPHWTPDMTAAGLAMGVWDGSFHNPLSTSRIHLAPPRPSAAGRGVLRGAPGRLLPLQGGSAAARLRSLIAAAEVGRLGYDAVHLGARRAPPARPTALTLGEVLAWVRATPGQPHAIGRYQFIPATLRDLIRRTGTPLSARFDAGLQDRFADVLLRDAGYRRFTAGEISRRRFMNNLARIWAGLPTSSGRSAYHGHAGNAATISWADYDRHMAAIFD